MRGVCTTSHAGESCTIFSARVNSLLFTQLTLLLFQKQCNFTDHNNNDLSPLCLYLTESNMDNRALLAYGALLQCSSLLVSLGGAVAKGDKEEGMELVRK